MPVWGAQRVAEGTGRAGEDKSPHASCNSALEQVQRASNVDIDKVLPAVRVHMRLVQRGGVQHGIDTLHAAPDDRAIDDRAQHVGAGSGNNVEAGDGVPLLAQGANDGIAQMTGATRDEDLHTAEIYRSRINFMRDGLPAKVQWRQPQVKPALGHQRILRSGRFRVA